MIFDRYHAAQTKVHSNKWYHQTVLRRRNKCCEFTQRAYGSQNLWQEEDSLATLHVGQMIEIRLWGWNWECNHTCATPWNTRAVSAPRQSPQYAWPGWGGCWGWQRAAEVGKSAVLQVWKAPALGRHHSDSLQNKFKLHVDESREMHFSPSKWHNSFGLPVWGKEHITHWRNETFNGF